MKKIPSRVTQTIKTKNYYSSLESEESPTENKNTRTDSPNTKITAKQNAINTAAQSKQNSNGTPDIPDKRKLPVTVIIGNSMVKGIKGWKI